MPTIELCHFSKRDFLFRRTYEYVQDGNFKPVGLWLSDESPGSHGWLDWSQSERYALDRLANKYVFTVDLSRILHLKTIQELRSFTKKYLLLSEYVSIQEIDWNKVRSQYGGILISPYQWQCRHELRWYYTWDCASACIWDLTAIFSYRRIANWAPPILENRSNHGHA